VWKNVGVLTLLDDVQEFYIPVQSSAIFFLKSKLCVACINGFEILDPDTLDKQGLLDRGDESTELMRRRVSDKNEVKPKPMALYRIENEFLLCFDGAWLCCECYPMPLIALLLPHRIRILHQPQRVPVAPRLYGALGGHANELR